MNAPRPPVWRYSVRMSGVLGQKFGRKNSAGSPRVSSVEYSRNSQAEFRQAKYVYDWVKPSLANRYMTLGRVKASDRKMRSGSCRLSSVITHSQNGNDLVWGLSTRKIFTPSAIQNSKTPFSACHSPSGSDVSKSSG